MKYFIILVVAFSFSLVAGELENGLEQVKVENYEAAANSFTKAAMCDDFIAQQNLGVLLNNGLGVAYDPDQASYWFGKKDRAKKLEAKLQKEQKKFTHKTFVEKIFPFLDSKPKVQQGFLISQQ
jgi:hypothetical protein